MKHNNREIVSRILTINAILSLINSTFVSAFISIKLSFFHSENINERSIKSPYDIFKLVFYNYYDDIINLSITVCMIMLTAIVSNKDTLSIFKNTFIRMILSKDIIEITRRIVLPVLEISILLTVALVIPQGQDISGRIFSSIILSFLISIAVDRILGNNKNNRLLIQLTFILLTLILIFKNILMIIWVIGFIMSIFSTTLIFIMIFPISIWIFEKLI